MFEAIARLPPGDAMQVTRMGRQGLLLSRAYGDPVEVWVVDGRPSRFVWRGRLYTVRQVLEHWVATRDWWRDRNPDAEEATEREFWQVEAAPDKEELGIYELRHDAATDTWMLSRVWD